MADIVGNISAKKTLSGSINVFRGEDGKSAYEIAQENGFEGTESEWLESLKGKSGVYVGSGDMPDDCNVQIDPNGESLTLTELIIEAIKRLKRKVYVTLLASEWVGEASPYSQVVTIEGVTENSQVDLTPSAEQLETFRGVEVGFVAENENGVVKVYAIGNKPMNDYVIQATVKEVARDEE